MGASTIIDMGMLLASYAALAPCPPSCLSGSSIDGIDKESSQS